MKLAKKNSNVPATKPAVTSQSEDDLKTIRARIEHGCMLPASIYKAQIKAVIGEMRNNSALPVDLSRISSIVLPRGIR